MNHQALKTIYLSIREGIALQCLLTLVTLPFILWWQLPFSLLSLVGNLVFPFFLTIFLSLSSIIFFSALLGIDTTLLSTLLIGVQHAWETALTLPLPPYWIPFSWPDIALLMITALIWLLPPLHHYQRRFIIIMTACTALALMVRFMIPAPAYSILTRKGATVEFLHYQDNNVEIIDHGFISRVRCNDSVIDYDIVPHLCWHHKVPRSLIISGLTRKKTNWACSLLGEWGFTATPGALYEPMQEDGQRHTSSASLAPVQSRQPA